MDFYEVCKILEEYDREALLVSDAYGDGGLDPLWPRLERAALNQSENGLAAFSRYGIWANTVRDNIRHAMNLIDEGNEENAKEFLTRAANSLSAFSAIQALAERDETYKAGHTAQCVRWTR